MKSTDNFNSNQIYDKFSGLSPDDLKTIKMIEEISLNAWPSHKMELYDGWLIRFSHNYTHRTNSVHQVAESLLPVEEKVAYCEDIYRNYHTPCIFKISPLVDEAFDQYLADQGYQPAHVTENYILDYTHFTPYGQTGIEYEYYGRNSGLPSFVVYQEDVIVQLRDRIGDDWIQALFRLNGTNSPTLRRIVPSMYHAIPKETICAYIEIDGRIVATGLGIMDRNFVGIYAIYVDPSCRRKHFARSICSAILSEANKKGADKAYLQVVRGNQPARSLYESLGFEYLYTYWFRSREV